MLRLYPEVLGRDSLTLRGAGDFILLLFSASDSWVRINGSLSAICSNTLTMAQLACDIDIWCI